MKEASASFSCVCCGSHRNGINVYAARTGRDREIAPICLSCERTASYDWTGRARTRNVGTAGTFMDRRNIMRGAALADHLAAEASRIAWREQHGRP